MELLLMLYEIQMDDDTNKDPIANILNITPMKVKEDNIVIYQDSSEKAEQELESDISYARDMIYGSIKDSSDAVEEMLEIAKQTQHPRAFEVVATLINAKREATKDLLDLHKKRKDLKKQDKDDGPDTVNNNVFVGTTEDLLKLIKK